MFFELKTLKKQQFFWLPFFQQKKPQNLKSFLFEHCWGFPVAQVLGHGTAAEGDVQTLGEPRFRELNGVVCFPCFCLG